MPLETTIMGWNTSQTVPHFEQTAAFENAPFLLRLGFCESAQRGNRNVQEAFYMVTESFDKAMSTGRGLDFNPHDPHRGY